MVKPALPYLDIISAARRQTGYPVAACQVSGEYSMIKAAAQAGWLDEPAGHVLESLWPSNGPVPDMILTYFAKREAAKLLR
ncbi:MAG: hypothetical protein U0361_04225 [Nitrospiraceae bacterium]